MSRRQYVPPSYAARPYAPRRLGLRSLALSLTAILFFPVTLAAAVSGVSGQEVGGTEPSASIVGQLPILESDQNSNFGNHNNDGWLILDTQSRRAYEVFNVDATFPSGTAIWSFDLDTLQPIRRVFIENFKVIASGDANTPGDVVHAIDEGSGLLFLAGYTGINFLVVTQVSVAVIDEAKIDNGDSNFFKLLNVPPNQTVELANRQIYGMSFHRESGRPKLLLLLSLPGIGAVNKQLNDHWVAQWDVETGFGDWPPVLLDPCARAPLVFPQAWYYQLEILRGSHGIYVGCQQNNSTALTVEIPLSLDGTPDRAGLKAFQMPRRYSNVLADPGAERLLFMMELGGISLWTFDAKARSLVGATGLSLSTNVVSGGVDPSTGRMYSLIPNHTVDVGGSQVKVVKGGLFATDTRLTPVPQAQNLLPSLAYPGQFRIWVDPERPGYPRRVFVRRGNTNLNQMVDYSDPNLETSAPKENFYLVIKEETPVASEPALSDVDRNTIDQPEEPGVTGANFHATASGYGFRSLLIGGVNAVVDRGLDNSLTPACYKNDRELAIGELRSATLSDLQTGASSISFDLDESSKADLQSPSSRCWAGLILPSLPPDVAKSIDSAIGRPWDSNGDGKDDFTAECSGDEGRKDAPTPAYTGRQYTSWVSCEQAASKVQGFSSGAFALDAPGLKVRIESASSALQISRDPQRGVVTHVESIARTVEIEGVGTIGIIRTTTDSWAAGRVGEAGTSFSRSICGVDLPSLKQSQCLDDSQQAQFIQALNRALGTRGEVRLRQPDSEFARGSPGGYLAAVRRDAREAFSDEIITRDSSKAVPGLEIIFYRTDDPARGAGRQVFQFAGVQASSAYGIFCLFGQEDNGDCIRPTAELTVALTDDSDPPKPLEGGVFEVHADKDGDGLVGLNDPVVQLTDSTAVCQTTDDGTGDCSFELAPGNYIVHETTPPAGYAPAPDCAVSLTAWITQTCNFVNLKAIGTVDLALTDDSVTPKPLPGGTFEVYSDDGDESLGSSDLKLATCSTSETGSCVFDPTSITAGQGVTLTEHEALLLPLGTYVVHQKAAPTDYMTAGDVAFILENPKDAAHLTFVNGLTPIEEIAGTQTVPSTVAGNSGSIVPSQTVVIEEGSASPTPTVDSRPIPQPQEPSVVTRIIRGPSEAVKFLMRHPKEAILFGAMWLLLLAPLYMAWRRHSLSLEEGLAF